MTDKEKPPLGVIPRDVWEVRQGMVRVYDLIEGIKEYENSCLPIPQGWCDELSELIEKYLPKLVSSDVENKSLASERFKDKFDTIFKWKNCRCPDGLGKVVSWGSDFPNEYIKVETFENNRGCHWPPDNVEFNLSKKSGWINVFHGIDNCMQTGIKIYNTAEDAVLGVTKQGTLDKDYIVTIFIEVEV